MNKIFFFQAKHRSRAPIAISNVHKVSLENSASLDIKPCKTPKTRVLVTGTPALINLRAKDSPSKKNL